MWVVVWHGRRQVVNAPLALRQCYMSIRKSTGRHTRWQYLRHLVIRRKYGEPFAPVYGRSRNTSSVRSTSGHSLLGVWQRSTSGHRLLGVWQNTTSGLDTARVSQSSSGHSLLGYLQSTSGLDTARVTTVYFRAWYSSGIYSLLLGLIQLGLSALYFRAWYSSKFATSQNATTGAQFRFWSLTAGHKFRSGHSIVLHHYI